MKHVVYLVLLTCASLVQAQSPKSFVGTIAGFRAESAQIEIRPDNGDAVIATVGPETLAQKVAPGSHDLKSVQPIKITDVAIGDRVLVTLQPGTQNMLRIVVMPATEISQRNDADRRDWDAHGVSGIVAAKSGNTISLKTRTLTGESQAVVTVDDKTSFKRYAPDSVKFADAKSSKLAELSVGDQLRARGEKTAEGLKVAAHEVVFGTFLVKAGAITAIDAASRQITIKELGTDKTLTIAVTADSLVKQMPSFPGMAGPGRGSPGNAPPGAPGGLGMPGRGAPGGAPGGFDINQMLERMPVVTLTDLKPGTQLVVSSTKGADATHLTAIMVLGNADMLIQMATAMSNNGRGRGDMGVGMGGPSMGGMMGGDLSGLGLAGMIMQ
jgi:hypothetical protein